MPRFIFGNEEWEYILKEDRNDDGTPKHGVPRWILRQLPRTIRKHIENNTIGFKQSSANGSDKADTIVSIGDRHEQAVKFGLKNIEGIEGWFETQFIPRWGVEGLKESTLDVIRLHIAELGAEIWDKSTLTKEAEKNSATPSK